MRPEYRVPIISRVTYRPGQPVLVRRDSGEQVSGVVVGWYVNTGEIVVRVDAGVWTVPPAEVAPMLEAA